MDALKTIEQRAAIERFHGEHDQSSHAGGRGGGGSGLTHGTNSSGVKARVARHPKGFIARAGNPEGKGETAGKPARTRALALKSLRNKLGQTGEYDPYKDPDSEAYREHRAIALRDSKVTKVVFAKK